LDGRDNDLETKASSTIRARAGMAGTISQDTSSDLETSEINSRSSTESDTNGTRYEDESHEDISSYKKDYEQSPSQQEYDEYTGGYTPDMDELTMLRKELADLQNEMERAMEENVRLRHNRDEAGGSEMYENELSGHRVMAYPDDSTQESSAWMGKSMGRLGYNQ
jgi:hypothetical protein